MRGIAACLLLSLGAAALGGCAVPSSEVPPVPLLAGYGGRSPVANAIEGAAEAFSGPDRLRGRPADAAVAVSRLEWEAMAIPAERSFFLFSNSTGPALMAARWEVRDALGIDQGAPGGVVIAGMEAAALALARGDAPAAAAALPAPVFAPDTIGRLGGLPRLAQANQATRRAQRDIEFGREDRWRR